MLLKRNEMEPFFKWIITGDEKWVKYENIKRKRPWSKAGDLPQTISKPGLTKNKILLSVWWDWKGIMHYELLQSGETINSVLYCAQLDRLNEAIQKERPELAHRKGVVFHHDNSGNTHLWWLRTNWRYLDGKFWCIHRIARILHRRTSICFALCKTRLMVKNLPTETAETHLGKLFNNKPQKFYTERIMKLPEKWQRS